MKETSEIDEYFSYSSPALSDSLRPRPAGEDSLDDLFTLSGCNTPLETAPAVMDGVSASSDAHQHGAGGEKLRRKPNSGTDSTLYSPRFMPPEEPPSQISPQNALVTDSACSRCQRSLGFLRISYR